MPIDLSHSGTSNDGQALAASWLCPTILTDGFRLWKSSTYYLRALACAGVLVSFGVLASRASPPTYTTWRLTPL